MSADTALPTVHGAVERGFEPVARAFADAFAGKPRMGGALAVLVEGRTVVDVWAGTADARTGRAWEENTPSVIFSCTKGLMSLLAARLVQQGLLDYRSRVAEVWPEYAAEGKGDTRLEDLLAHRAGLPAPREPLSLDEVVDWQTVTARLAAQQPLWEPGSSHAYHAITHGWLIGEVIRRATGMSVGAAFARHIARPVDAECWIGAPAAITDAVAHMAVGPTLAQLTAQQEAEARAASGIDWPGLSMTLGGAFPRELVADGIGFNDPVVQRAEIPGAGGIATARGLARIWSASVDAGDGEHALLAPATLREATRVRSEGLPFFPVPAPWPRWGAGFQLDSEARRYLTASGFGHDGAGGQVAFADPTSRVGFAFLTNQMEAIDDVRGTAIVDALRRIVI